MPVTYLLHLASTGLDPILPSVLPLLFVCVCVCTFVQINVCFGFQTKGEMRKNHRLVSDLLFYEKETVTLL